MQLAKQAVCALRTQSVEKVRGCTPPQQAHHLQAMRGHQADVRSQHGHEQARPSLIAACLLFPTSYARPALHVTVCAHARLRQPDARCAQLGQAERYGTVTACRLRAVRPHERAGDLRCTNAARFTLPRPYLSAAR